MPDLYLADIKRRLTEEAAQHRRDSEYKQKVNREPEAMWSWLDKTASAKELVVSLIDRHLAEPKQWDRMVQVLESIRDGRVESSFRARTLAGDALVPGEWTDLGPDEQPLEGDRVRIGGVWFRWKGANIDVAKLPQAYQWQRNRAATPPSTREETDA